MEKYEQSSMPCIDEIITRYCTAFDELEYLGRNLAKRMAKPDEYESAKDYLEAMVTKAETLLEDLELMHGDACELVHSEGDNK